MFKQIESYLEHHQNKAQKGVGLKYKIILRLLCLICDLYILKTQFPQMSGCSKSLKTHHLLDKLYAMNMNFETTNIFKICWEYALSGKEVMTRIHSSKRKWASLFRSLLSYGHLLWAWKAILKSKGKMSNNPEWGLGIVTFKKLVILVCSRVLRMT